MVHLSPRAKLDRLMKIARGKRQALILTHDNPDPDCIASAIGLAYFLENRAGIDARAGFGGIIGRAENVAMVRELKLTLWPLSRIVFDEYDLLGLVDTQPSVGNHSLPPRYNADLVVDHHPLREPSLTVPFADVGGDYGATSTLVTQYLQAAKLPLPTEIATALYYGIKADTRDLGRQTTAADVEAYLWLFPQVDKKLLGQIEHPELPARYFRLYHKAIERAKVYGAAIVADLGEVYSPDMVAEVAERLLNLEGRKWSLAFGSYRSQLYFSLRTRDRRMNAGRLMREICEDHRSSAGGHGSMAGARIPLSGTQRERQTRKRQLVQRFLQEFGVSKEKPESLLHSEAL
jgi:nanoRNase/pAp phosphatase (c-di-AMP/oligoRNAs hydrolase)